jgi:hypothetical protein
MSMDSQIVTTIMTQIRVTNPDNNPDSQIVTTI